MPRDQAYIAAADYNRRCVSPDRHTRALGALEYAYFTRMLMGEQSTP